MKKHYICAEDLTDKLLYVDINDRKGSIEHFLDGIPFADVISTDDVLKFYYCRSLDEYMIGQTVGDKYYAVYDPKSKSFTWRYSKHLPWGETISLYATNDFTYPSEPEEMDFCKWLQRFIFKYIGK